ncbi:MAG: adenylate kinase [Acidobacteriota bacterium]
MGRGKIIVMVGAPGAGKGTQSRLLADHFGYPQISTGEILRRMSQADTALGREIKGVQAAGLLVSDDVLGDLILARTSEPDCKGGYILDGFPRTLHQAEMLETLAERQGKGVVLVRVVVSHDALMKRLTGRRTCPVCGEIYNIYSRPPKQEGVCDVDGATLTQRSDDNPEAVSTRLTAYEESTKPLIDYYKNSGRLVQIDGERPVSEVYEKLISVIEGSESRVVPGN